jgi:D-arabinose 1-dehydrogenase-like Zn-dependent alcohol dehydrogenase
MIGGDTRFPLVPSHEVVGTVEQTGCAVTKPALGDRVGVGYQVGACFECSYCRQGVEQFCPKQTVIGVSAHGGLGDTPRREAALGRGRAAARFMQHLSATA